MNNATAIIIIILVVAGGLWFLMRSRTTRAVADNTIRDIKQDIQDERQAHHRALSSALAACQDAHPEAVNALTWLAGADGVVSKQELRLVFNFCEAQGVVLNKSAYKAIDSLNAGMSMQIKATETAAHASIDALASRPPPYKAAFFGTAHKICGSQKRLTAAKERFLKKAEALIIAAP